METNINNSNVSSVVKPYSLTQADLDQIETDADDLIEFADNDIELDTEPQLKWSIGSNDFMSLCKYQEWLRPNFSNKFGSDFHLEHHLGAKDKTGVLYLVIDRFGTSFDEITEVSKYIFETAADHNCYYFHVEIDLIMDDDTRVQWDSL